MFLAGLIGLAAVGGAAYAIGDVFIEDEDEQDEGAEDESQTEISEG